MACPLGGATPKQPSMGANGNVRCPRRVSGAMSVAVPCVRSMRHALGQGVQAQEQVPDPQCCQDQNDARHDHQDVAVARRRDEGAQVRRLLDPFLIGVHQLKRRDGPAPQRRRGLGQRRGSCHQSFQGSGASAALNSSTSARYRFHAGASASRSAAVSRSPAARVAAASRSLSVIGTVWGPITTCECEIV